MSVFFQAEDGIRYLVRSRGLGDVYKRQVIHQNYNNNKETDRIYLNQDVTSDIEHQKQLETALNLSLIHI